jgi:endo-1,4-beta-xylanase
VTVNVSDAISGLDGTFKLVSVTSNEPDGAGDIQGFTIGTASTTGFLRASRLGSGNGRTYTLTYMASDRAGNTASCKTTVAVPHDKGK